VIQVGQSWRGAGADPEPDGPFALVDPAHAVPATSRTAAAGPGGARTYRVVDAGWYAWRIRGVDAFGRVGGWGTSVVAEVRHSVDPPPPLQVSARYLDPADPYLSEADRALTGDRPGLLVQWAWPAGRRMQAPQLEPAGEFRVYLLRGEPNRVSGTATTAKPDGDLSRLTTDLTWPGAPDDLTGQLIRVGGDTFEIAGHGAGRQAWFDVRHRSAPLLRPAPGPVSLTLTAGVAGFRDLTDPLTYDRRETVVPVGSPAIVTSVVTAVGSGADPTVTLAATVPAPGIDDDPAGGLLLCQGIAYRVTAQTAGTRVLGIAAQTQPDGSVLLPAGGAPATLWNAARYQAWLPGSVEPAAAEAFAEVTVAVSAADGDTRVADAACWDRPGRGGLGSRPGREGPAAVAPPVRVPHRTPPPALTAPRPSDQDGDVPAVVAGPADWYGRAHWTVPLDAVPGVTGYRVLRASAAALFDLDRRLRQTGAPPYAGGPFDDAGASAGWLAQHYPDLSVADLTADLTAEVVDAGTVRAAWRDWSTWFYPRLSNRAVMDLADLDTHREVFGPAHARTVPGPAYRDTIDGRGTGRFVYRVVTVDASGNAGPWSATFPIVEVRDVTAPKTPTLLSALGDENAAVLTWRANTEPDLSGYRVWRAPTAEALDDVRRRPPYARLPIEAGAQAQTWTDSGLTAFAEYHYRVAAVDRAGNVSPPTHAVRVRAVDSYPPDPPQWRRVERVLVRSSDGAVLPADTEPDPAQEYSPAVALAWIAGEDGVTCLVERRRTRERIFVAVTGWLTPTTAPRTFSWLDPTADPRTETTYRVRARDAAGNEQRYRWNPATVNGEGAPR
jgi:hypothetical protein